MKSFLRRTLHVSLTCRALGLAAATMLAGVAAHTPRRSKVRPRRSTRAA